MDAISPPSQCTELVGHIRKHSPRVIHRTVTGAQHDDIEVVSGGDTATPALKLALATTLHLELQ